MGVISVKTEICNLALNKLGDNGTIENIDIPVKSAEKVFSRWYDIVRQNALKKLMPNFSQSRRIVSQAVNNTPDFGYAYAYSYPIDCLRLLSIGNTQDKENTYSIEEDDDKLFIFTDDDYTTSGLPIRFVKDITDVGLFTSEFALVLSTMLAKQVCFEITKDHNKNKMLGIELKEELASASALSSMENKPIIISTSKFGLARYTHNPRTYNKK